MTNESPPPTEGLDAAEDPTTIHVDEFFPHPPARVWRALTTPELMAKWLMANDFEPRVGHRFTLQAKPIPAVGFSGTVACTVLRLEAPRLLSISWADAEPSTSNSLESTVTWELREEGTGTRLFLEHTGFDPDDPTHQLSRRTMGGGWRRTVLRRLGEVLDDVASLRDG